MVLDVNKFRCRNSGEKSTNVQSINLKVLHLPTTQGIFHKVTIIPGVGCYGLGFPGYFCCVGKRLGGYWRKWKTFQGHLKRWVVNARRVLLFCKGPNSNYQKEDSHVGEKTLSLPNLWIGSLHLLCKVGITNELKEENIKLLRVVIVCKLS